MIGSGQSDSDSDSGPRGTSARRTVLVVVVLTCLVLQMCSVVMTPGYVVMEQWICEIDGVAYLDGGSQVMS